jgi:hypothetical protein
MGGRGGGVRRPVLFAAVVVAAAAVWFVAGRGGGRVAGGMAQARRRAAPTARQQASRWPLSFEQNRGQAGADVQYVAHGLGYAAFLSRGGVLLGMERSPAPGAEALAKRSRNAGGVQSGVEGGVRAGALRMEWLGSSRRAEAVGLERQPGVSNYFFGNDARHWMTGIPHFARVRYAGVYPGVDLIYHGSSERLEYDFSVAPGADPAVIRLRLSAAGGRGARLRGLSLTPRGGLRAALAGGGAVEFLRPVAYQPVPGGAATQPVRARFRLLGGGQAGFAIGAYDHSRPLVIDPTIAFSTYLGGSGNDLATSVALDGSGNVYIAGSTFSTNFPTSGGYQSSCASCGAGTADAFLAKLSADGKTLIYSTFLGGNAEDDAYGVAVDSGGNAYLTGRTFSTNFPLAAPVQATCGSCAFNLPDAFVAKIGPAGATLAYSTFLGGLGEDDGTAIAVDAAGDAYITGRTNSTNYPLSSPYQGSSGGGFDALVTELNPAGSALVYSTYLGGGSEDDGYGIAVDSTGAAYVTGQTYSNNFPSTAGAVQSTFGGGVDAFVTKLNAGGGGLAYSTYLGGTSNDSGHAIAVDGSGNAYVTGATSSPDFPMANAAQGVYGGGTDAFISKLGPKGAALIYSTYLGGSGADLGNSVAVDAAGKAYLAGVTSSTNLELVNATQTTYNGNQDAFAAKLTPTGCGFGFLTYFGGHATDIGNGVAVDSGGNPVMVGQTFSNDIFTQAPYQAATGGQLDAFAVKYTGLAGPVDCFAPQSLKFAGQVSASTSAPENITFTNDGESALTLTSIVASGPFAETNTCGSSVNSGQNCTISVTFTPTAAGTANGALTVTDNGPNSPHALALTGTGLDFGLSASPGSNTVAAGQSVVYTITVAPSPGFKDTVALSCTGAPAAATCTLNPSSVTLNGSVAQTSTMTVTTTSRSMALPRGRGNPAAPGKRTGEWPGNLLWLMLPALAAMAAGLAAGAKGRKAAGVTALAGFLLLVAMAFASCGGTGKAFGGGTPPGSFGLTVTGTDGNLTHSIRVTLTVQ